MINKFDPKEPTDVHENASQALCDIIAVSANSASSPLIAQLESEAVVSTIFGFMLPTVCLEPVLSEVVRD